MKELMKQSKSIGDRRFVSGVISVEKRETEDEDVNEIIIEGYAANFNERADIAGLFDEEILPGAFDGVLGDDVRALYNHDPSKVLARTASNTLSISVDSKGLKYRFVLPDRSYARDMADAIASGDVSQSSFFFDVDTNGQEWIEQENGRYLRKIKRFTALYDVSPVTYPAYRGTSVSKRSQEDFEEAKKQFESRETEKVKLDGFQARCMYNQNRLKQ